jgi:hypothetical protein
LLRSGERGHAAQVSAAIPPQPTAAYAHDRHQNIELEKPPSTGSAVP